MNDDSCNECDNDAKWFVERLKNWHDDLYCHLHIPEEDIDNAIEYIRAA